MPPIAAAIAAIAAAVASITAGIVSIIATIASVIATVISFILTKVVPLIANFAAFVVSGIRTVMLIIGRAVYSIGVKLFSTIVSTFTSFITKVMSIFAGVWNTIKMIVGQIRVVISSFLGEVGNILKPIIDAVKSFVTPLVNTIKQIIGKIREVYTAIKASIVGKIIGYVKDVTDVLSTIHAIALAYNAFGEKKYLKSLYILTIHFDKSLAEEVKGLYTYIESQLASTIKEISDVFDVFRKDINSLSAYTMYMERIFFDIARFLDVPFAKDIAKGLEKFRTDVLKTAKDWLTETKKDILEWTSWQLHPVYHIIRVLKSTEREYRDYQRIYSYFMLDTVRKEKILPPKTKVTLLPVLVKE